MYLSMKFSLLENSKNSPEIIRSISDLGTNALLQETWEV